MGEILWENIHYYSHILLIKVKHKITNGIRLSNVMQRYLKTNNHMTNLHQAEKKFERFYHAADEDCFRTIDQICEMTGLSLRCC